MWLSWLLRWLTPAPAAPAPAPAPPAPEPRYITDMVLRAMGVEATRAGRWAPIIAAACAEFGIVTRKNIACFLANVLQETGNLSVFRENLNYSPEGLARTWPTRFLHDGAPSAKAIALGRIGTKPANQRGIAEAVYGGRGGNGPEGSGDGFAYIGRGWIQITFKNGYQATATAFGMRLEDVAAWLETPEGAARASAEYWRRAGLNRHGDAGDIFSCRAIANAGTANIARHKVLGLAEVEAKYAKLLTVLPE